ncbi:Oxysterol-binding protein 1-like, partial [Homarus americanus]
VLIELLHLQACNDYVEVSSTAGRKWQRLLQHERDQRVRLEDMVEQLARQHSHLEQEAKEQMNQAMPPGVQNPVPTSSTVEVNVFGQPEQFSLQGEPPGW